MGGLGSGRYYRRGGGNTVEGCRRIDVRRWHRDGFLWPGHAFSWAWWDEDGAQTASISVTVGGGAGRALAAELRYTLTPEGENPERVRYKVPVSWTPCHYGGQRPWFVCPGNRDGRACGRRVALLYLSGRYFLCRHCYGLAYESQRESGEDRLMSRAHKIKRRLGGRPGWAYPWPEKPKGMHWRTYWRLTRKAEQAEHRSLRIAAERFGFLTGILDKQKER